MAQIDDAIATNLTAIEVEGKTENTVLSHRASLEDFRRALCSTPVVAHPLSEI